MRIYSVNLIIILLFHLLFSNMDNLNNNNIIKPITDIDALNLVNLSNRYYEVVNGGFGYSDGRSCDTGSIVLNGEHFVYYCGFDSVGQIYEYLTQVFTPAFTFNFMNNVKIQEYNGKVITLDLGAGDVLDWSKSKIVSTQALSEEEIIYTFDVPDPDDHYWNVVADFKFVRTVGWRLNNKLQ
jgi:hypothetical protein